MSQYQFEGHLTGAGAEPGKAPMLALQVPLPGATVHPEVNLAELPPFLRQIAQGIELHIPTGVQPAMDVHLPVQIAFLRQVAGLVGKRVKVTVTVEEAAEEVPAVPMPQAEGRQ